jgi:hypothetical protein
MARRQNLLVKIMKELNEGKASNPALTAQIIDHPNTELCTCRLVICDMFTGLSILLLICIIINLLMDLYVFLVEIL